MKFSILINSLFNAFHMGRALIMTNLLYKLRFGKIGPKSILFGSFVCVSSPDRIFIGSGVRILKYARLDCITSWRGRLLEPSLIISDNVNIGHNFFVSCAARVLIGEGVLISDNVAIIDNDHEHQIGISSSKTPISINEIIIERNVTIYRGSTILKGSHIEEGAVIGANSIVKGRVHKNTIVAGINAKFIKNVH